MLGCIRMKAIVGLLDGKLLEAGIMSFCTALSTLMALDMQEIILLSKWQVFHYENLSPRVRNDHISNAQVCWRTVS